VIAARSWICAFILAACPASVGLAAASGPDIALPAAGGTPLIVVDQFGYLPEQDKVAILREPLAGFDAGTGHRPGAKIEIVRVDTGEVALDGSPSAWQGGATDPSSGDRIWSFDFSALTIPGTYQVVDPESRTRSPVFHIASDVYRPVLKAALRMLFYQRAGFAKDARFAGAQWADGASHLGPGQDLEARLFSRPDDAATARDLHGGWYDAGDYNRYTSWGARDVVELLHAYVENPKAWTDDDGIPESGNGIPDLLDEVKWELDWLVRMQNPDGSMLSILGVAHASPPSAARGPSFYGPPNTISALASVSAFALGAKVYGSTGRFDNYARELTRRAQAAWAWAIAHPDVTFRNNDPASGSSGLGAGQQESDDSGRAMERLVAAIHLFDLTGDGAERAYVDAHFREAALIERHFASPFGGAVETALLYYSGLPNASPAVAATIRKAYLEDLGGIQAWAATADRRDAYLAYLPAYVWGSNATKAEQGSLLIGAAGLVGAPSRRVYIDAAAHYIHYLHGVNPLAKVYLSNMGALGATRSVMRFYHTWFAAGSAPPPPGYLVGGPDPGYSWDTRCPGVSPACGSRPPSPPADQPPQKSYADFSTGWPLNSWQITEPDIGYQAAYIRLLSKFVR
jgi:endoglucanase